LQSNRVLYTTEEAHLQSGTVINNLSSCGKLV